MRAIDNTLKALGIVIVSLSLGACGQRQKTQQDDVVLKAYRLIDEQRDDEAIELLEAELVNSPSNYDFKVVLASVYAHKAGIKIQKLVPVMVQTENLKKLQEKKSSPASEAPKPAAEVTSSKGSEVNKGALEMASLFHQFAGTVQVYAAIPVVAKKDSVYLVHAIYLLNELGTEIKPEDAVYRAVLSIVLFKYYLAESFVGEFAQPLSPSEQSCRLDLGRVNDTIIQLGKLLISVYGDIGYSNPKQAPAMKQLADQTADSISSLTILTTSVTALDEAANIFLKQTAILNGFGKIIKCGGS